ncbi:LOW QUALITY PROTEIN: deoxynucleoside triphosphate triphosphohydrolase SAMHD1-like [Osmerus mordax]|uniref:LOW QUALITY PROTEIN: deoxynucleoside triphosphate triphosphohydrolase SAMHD1-like n=1 Tax=Osmerus mordax TaxID=8014 RepID=UPI00350F8AE5
MGVSSSLLHYSTLKSLPGVQLPHHISSLLNFISFPKMSCSKCSTPADQAPYKQNCQFNVQGKVFKDPIHGLVPMHPLLVRIIDTPQFQRLRYIKQLGGACYVYPGATHNRFEHSIGVSHLAGKLVKELNDRQPELQITCRDFLCVQIAGLCHDLGHGPFSHLFDGMFIPKVHREIESEKKKKKEEEEEEKEDKEEEEEEEEKEEEEEETRKKKWKVKTVLTELKHTFVFTNVCRQDVCMCILVPLCSPESSFFQHEDASVAMFKHLVKQNKLKKMMETHGLVLKEDLVFIEEQIAGPIDPNEWQGRPKKKSFLYEIIANKRNGVDVDKWDYFARDFYFLGLQSNFDHDRYINFARVCKVDEEYQICTRDKEVDNLYDMFHTRFSLHRQACQHRVVEAIQLMIADALVKANPHILIEGSGGKTFRMSETIFDMEAYSKLTDCVFEQILYSTSPELAEAREILENITHRRLYKFVANSRMKVLHTQVCVGYKDGKNISILGLRTWIFYHSAYDFTCVKLPQVIKMDYGMKEDDPIDQMRFYSKKDPTKAFKISDDQVLYLKPKIFSQNQIRIYSKRKIDEPTKAEIERDLRSKFPKPQNE